MPVAFISTRTSPAFGPSKSSSIISSGFFASNATAARVFICHISLKNLAWARVFLSFEFLVPSELPRQSACSGHHMVCGNPDEHPSVSPEHCTVTPNVKTDNFNHIVFSAERVAGRGQANVPHFGPIPSWQQQWLSPRTQRPSCNSSTLTTI